MAKKKLSFDIEQGDYEHLRLLSHRLEISQGELIRRAVRQHIEKNNVNVVSVFVLENETLVKKSVDLSKCTIEKDAGGDDFVKEFNFAEAGWLLNKETGDRARYYSRSVI